MQIAVISYNIPHRKTQDVLFRLKAQDYNNVTLCLTPFKPRKPFTPIYKHRPSNCIQIEPTKLCEQLNYKSKLIEIEELHSYFKSNSFDYILIAGAGLLPTELVLNHRIINTHPGWLPNVRGLDSLKWAIHKQEILGVTSHIINDSADAGLLIEQKKVEIFQNDTFHSVAYRQYELEIEMLVNTIQILETNPKLEQLSETYSESTRRMPKEIEQNLLESFNKYLQTFGKK